MDYPKPVFYYCFSGFIYSSKVKAENIIKNEIFYLDENYYTNNNQLKWENITIDFSKFHPLGRLALAKEEVPSNLPGIEGNILSKNIKWQFLKISQLS